jgi:hypothetical protein
VVHAERLLDAVAGAPRARDRHQPGVADHRVERREVTGEPANLGERSEVEATPGREGAQPLARILEDPGLPGRAGEAIALLLTVLVISTLMLVPGQPLALLGPEVLAVGLWVSSS